MQQHKPGHPCPQAVPILLPEAIFDEPDQIPIPVEKNIKSDVESPSPNPIEERCGKIFYC